MSSDSVTVLLAVISLTKLLVRLWFRLRSERLRDVDLSRVDLSGGVWPEATRWPSDDWKAQALLDSRQLSDGRYVIRGGTADVPTCHG